MRLPVQWPSGLLALLGIVFLGVRGHRSEIEPPSRDGPQEYQVHTAKRAPIAGDVVLADGNQLCAANESQLSGYLDALANANPERLSHLAGAPGFGVLRQGLHLRVLALGGGRLRVRAIELNQECWLTERAVWP